MLQLIDESRLRQDDFRKETTRAGLYDVSTFFDWRTILGFLSPNDTVVVLDTQYLQNVTLLASQTNRTVLMFFMWSKFAIDQMFGFYPYEIRKSLESFLIPLTGIPTQNFTNERCYDLIEDVLTAALGASYMSLNPVSELELKTLGSLTTTLLNATNQVISSFSWLSPGDRAALQQHVSKIKVQWTSSLLENATFLDTVIYGQWTTSSYDLYRNMLQFFSNTGWLLINKVGQRVSGIFEEVESPPYKADLRYDRARNTIGECKQHPLSSWDILGIFRTSHKKGDR